MDGSCHYWHNLRKYTLCFSKRNFNGKKVMVCTTFNKFRMLHMHFTSFKMNFYDYLQLLESYLLPFLSEKVKSLTFECRVTPESTKQSDPDVFTRLLRQFNGLLIVRTGSKTNRKCLGRLTKHVYKKIFSVWKHNANAITRKLGLLKPYL